MLLMSLLGCLLGQDLISGIGPMGPVKKVAGGFAFTEGPASDGKGNLYFSDIPNGRIHRLDADGKISIFRSQSNKSNGLMVARDGSLLACEMGGAVVALSTDGQNRTVLADQYNGKPFNAPNDLVIDGQDGIYFTDPMFGAKSPLPQVKTCVYYLPKAGKAVRLLDNLPNPNGVILSPDEKTLYVIPSSQKQMMAYPVETPGKLGVGRVFCELAQKDPQGNGGGDGLAVDIRGNLYITSGTGVQVYSQAGKMLGTLVFPEAPANCSFGGQANKTLYVTARTSLYQVELLVPGHRFAAP
ncbi:MAG: SMP-30/gluconolactonase/LRE family protein [Planctomycetota bacterium]|nr:SMP-30/gluconolactonase/LRE family protein [Planctomycetota bacterium]